MSTPVTTSPYVDMQQLRGPSTKLPTSAKQGQLIVTTDTNELYVGTGTGVAQIIGGGSKAHVTDRVLFDDNASVFADGIKGGLDPKGREGWHFTNAGNGQKINWYYYDQTAMNTTVDNFKGTYAVVTIDTNSVPYFAVYTSGQANVWYQSRRVYSIQNPANVTPNKYLIYTGQNPSAYPELPRIQFTADLTNTTLNKGPFLNTETIAYVTLQTDSGLPVRSYNFVAHNLGLLTTAQNLEVKLKIKSDASLVYPVTAAATVWTVTHNLGKRPAVTTVNSSGNVIHGDVQYTSDNQIKITFSTPLTGAIYFN